MLFIFIPRLIEFYFNRKPFIQQGEGCTRKDLNFFLIGFEFCDESWFVFLNQVSSAVDHVQQGNTALVKAKKLQKNSRKWMCVAILILLIFIIIIVVSVIKPWVHKNGA